MKYFSFLLLLLLISCSSNLDFDQADTLHISPVFEGDIMFLDINSNNLIDNQSQFRNVVQDTVDFGIFKEGKTRDSFEKAEISVQYSNTFERNFYTEYFFIDQYDTAVEQNSFNIAAASGNTAVTDEIVFVFDKNNNPNFVNFRKIVVRVTVTPSQLPVADNQLHIQTKGKFFTQITLD